MSNANVTQGTYGLFIFRDGAWQLWETGNKSYLELELNYLTNSLGAKAAIFRKI